MAQKFDHRENASWLEQVARTTQKSGQYLVAQKFRRIAEELRRRDRVLTVPLIKMGEVSEVFREENDDRAN